MVLILAGSVLWSDFWKVIGVKFPVPVSDSVRIIIALARSERQSNEPAYISQFTLGFMFSLLVVLALLAVI